MATDKKVIEALRKLKLLAEERAKAGWVWVIKGKIQKQIPPEKIAQHRADAWKVIKH